MDDAYMTLEKPAEGIYREKGSRFLAFGYSVSDEEMIKDILGRLRKKYHDARHHCYAYRLAEGDIYRFNDDGEPSGTGGKPIFSTITVNGLSNVLIVVVRYFGGKLLGMNRLSNAYRSAAADMIKNATLREAAPENIYIFEFPYPQMNEVMKIVKDENLPVIDPGYFETCSFETRIRKSRAETIIQRLSATVEGFRYTSKKID